MGKLSSRPAKRPAAGVRAEKLHALTELTRLMTSESQSARLFAEIARAATMLLDATAARVWIDDPTRQALRLQASFAADGQPDAFPSEHVVIPYNAGLTAASSSPANRCNRGYRRGSAPTEPAPRDGR